VSAVAMTLRVSRAHLSSSKRRLPARRRGRPPLPDEDLVMRIRALIADMPTYGYRRVHALLRRQARNGCRCRMYSPQKCRTKIPQFEVSANSLRG